MYGAIIASCSALIWYQLKPIHGVRTMHYKVAFLCFGFQHVALFKIVRNTSRCISLSVFGVGKGRNVYAISLTNLRISWLSGEVHGVPPKRMEITRHRNMAFQQQTQLHSTCYYFLEKLPFPFLVSRSSGDSSGRNEQQVG